MAEKWCPISDSNQGHTDFQSVALPTELIGQSGFAMGVDRDSPPVDTCIGDGKAAYRGQGRDLASLYLRYLRLSNANLNRRNRCRCYAPGRERRGRGWRIRRLAI
jgi:hypothetical protein